jgi:hypothetical protein
VNGRPVASPALERAAAEVADFTHCPSPQPPRRPVLGRVAGLLEAAGSERSGLPQGFTHRELACAAYEVDEPTAAQLSAVRRAVARLVADGRAERDEERDWPRQRRAGRHWRRGRDGRLHSCANPCGVVIRRVPTEADRSARRAVLEEASPWLAAAAR